MRMLGWRTRSSPLQPTAAVARGAASAAMARRLLARSDEQLALLQGVAGQETLIVIGEADRLPWVDGAVYLGRDPDCPALLLPTHTGPEICGALVERALLNRFPEHLPPLVVLPSETLVLSASAARPISRES